MENCGVAVSRRSFLQQQEGMEGRETTVQSVDKDGGCWSRGEETFSQSMEQDTEDEDESG